jgi:xylulokinase
MSGALLGLDLGTSAVKALICDDRGHVLGRGAAEHPISQPFPGAAEQDPDDWWNAAVTAVKQALSEYGGNDIAAIGLTGQMHGTVLLDKENALVMPAIIWADTRSSSEVREISSAIGKQRLIQIAGSPLATGFQAATVKWVQANSPENWHHVEKVLLPKDYLRLLLSGVFATDPSDASGTLLLDVNTRQWSNEILDAVGIERSQLPEILPADAIAGKLTPHAAGQFGLPTGIPIVAGGGDAPCGAVGAGVIDPTSMLLTISTGAQALVPSLSPSVDTSGRMHTFCAALAATDDQAAWFHMGATMVAGLAMRWLRDDVFVLPAHSGYDEMTAWAAMTPPGAGGLIFLPYLIGERTPHMNPNARGMFLGLTARHGREHLVRAVMEGVTFALFDAYEVLKQAGATPKNVLLAGGGAKSNLWQQILADVFDMAVSPLQATEQSARGAAMLAGAGLGWFDAATAAKDWASYGNPVKPNRGSRDIYRGILPVFRDAYVKHIEDFEFLTRLEKETQL